MDTFEPLIELRGEWRQAAAISVPAAAAQVAAALDRALDVLVDAEQVDEESLTMAAETVVKAVVARSDEVELLRRRLHRAIRDFVTVTAIDAAPTSADSGAFESEEALAAALFASVGDSIGLDDELFAQETAGLEPSRGRRIDERALKKSLAKDPGRTRKRIVNLVMLLIPVVIVAAVIVYVLSQSGKTGPAPTGQTTTVPCAARTDSIQNGCLDGAKAGCPNGTPGTASCSYTFAVSKAGQVIFVLHWDSDDAMTIEMLQADGTTPVGAPATATGGKATLTVADVPAGKYVLRVIGPSTATAPINFNVSAT